MSNDIQSRVVPVHKTGGEGLKRVVSMTGAYGFRNHTVKSIRDLLQANRSS